MEISIKRACLMLRITSIIMYLFCGLVVLFALLLPLVQRLDPTETDASFWPLWLVIIFASIIGCLWAKFVGFVSSALRQQRAWAWGAALVINGYYLVSPLFPLSLISMVYLLKRDVRQHFLNV